MSHTYGTVGLLPASASTADREDAIARLPPMPSPDYATRTAESACGTTVVLGLIAAAVGGMVGIQWDAQGAHKVAFLVVIGLEALIAIACLLGILCGDPGIIGRSPETVFPLPKEVEEKLRAGEPLDDLKNNIEGTDGRSFCVRCLVWRPAPSDSLSIDMEACVPCSTPTKVHHCSVCGRCVVHFDHHCGVFGRCIAGRPFSFGRGGNMGYFSTLISMAGVAIVTLFIALLTQQM